MPVPVPCKGFTQAMPVPCKGKVKPKPKQCRGLGFTLPRPNPALPHYNPATISEQEYKDYISNLPPSIQPFAISYEEITGVKKGKNSYIQKIQEIIKKTKWSALNDQEFDDETADMIAADVVDQLSQEETSTTPVETFSQTSSFDSTTSEEKDFQNGVFYQSSQDSLESSLEENKETELSELVSEPVISKTVHVHHIIPHNLFNLI